MLEPGGPRYPLDWLRAEPGSTYVERATGHMLNARDVCWIRSALFVLAGQDLVYVL